MKKVFILSLMLTIIAGAISAQQIRKPFFGKIHSVESYTPNQRSMIGTRVTLTDSTFFAVRPVTGVAYSFPNNQAMGFAGVSVGNTTYNYDAKTTYVNFSFDVVYSLGRTTATKDVQSDASSFGFGVYALNRTVGILLLWNKYKKIDDPEPSKYKPVVAVSWGINL